jgi:UrcA family protein
MNVQNLTCFAAAVVIGIGLIGTASNAKAAGGDEVIVEGSRFDPELQRRVTYADLNLALSPDQKTLKRRIATTAGNLCLDLSPYVDWHCVPDAVHSTDQQVDLAIERAHRQMAGLPVGPALAISMVVGSR